MFKRLIFGLALGLAFAASAAAQITVRGQIILPVGDLPRNPMRFYLTSTDGTVNEYRFTDSNGRFILERLSTNIAYTIFVASDGASYGDTRYTFFPAYEAAPRITLNPLPVKRTAPASTISVLSSYKPSAKVAAIYDQALSDLKKNDLASAETHLRQAIEMDPKYIAPLNDLGVLYLKQKKYPEAEETLRQALELDPKSSLLLLNLGITLNHMEKFSESIAPLRQALQLEPGLVAAHQHLGVALVETDQFQEAEKELTETAKASGADRVLTQFYLGKLYARTGDFQKSIAAFNEYLKLAPHAPGAEKVRELIERMKGQMSTPR